MVYSDARTLPTCFIIHWSGVGVRNHSATCTEVILVIDQLGNDSLEPPLSLKGPPLSLKGLM